MINVFQPSLGATEIAAVGRVFKRAWLGEGDETAAFVVEFAAHLGVAPEHLVPVSCATEGLFQILALLPAGKVLMPAIHFVGAGNAVLQAGHELVLCDVEPHTLQVDAESLMAHLDDSITAVLLLHYGGAACDMAEIRGAIGAHVTLIEDSACAVATRDRGQACGTFGDFGVWSFDAMKVLTCGEGGMVYCKDVHDAERLRRAVHLGLSSATGLQSGGERWWEFGVLPWTAREGPGRRAHFNDISAAIGRAQLARLPELVARRRELWHRYDQTLAAQRGRGNWLRLPPAPAPWTEHSAYFYWVQTPHRDALAGWLRERGVYTTFRYYPLHRAYGWPADVPMADWAADKTLLLPLHPGLSDTDVDCVCEHVSEFGRTLHG